MSCEDANVNKSAVDKGFSDQGFNMIQHGIAPSGFQGTEAEWQAEFDGFKQECIQVALFLWVGKGGVFSLIKSTRVNH